MTRHVFSVVLLFFFHIVSILSGRSPRLDLEKPLTKIAFGSCNNQDWNQSIFDSVVQYKPQLWIWLGDVVYNDDRVFLGIFNPSTPEMMHEKYTKQKNSSHYQKLIKNTPVIGIWDDHDFGINNGGKEFEFKKDGQHQFLSFLNEPTDSVRWTREGIYNSYTIGPVGKRIKIILIDSRYFRDPEESGLYGGDMLGERQWQWLKLELAQSDADMHLISSSIQLLPRDIPIIEKWANYPKSYNRLMSIFQETKPKGLFIISGDVHHAELFKKNCIGVGYPVYEATSSGLTHSCYDSLSVVCDYVLNSVMKSEIQTGVYTRKNFGTIEIDWDRKEITMQIRNETGDLVLEQKAIAGVPMNEICPKEKEVARWLLEPRFVLFKRLVFNGVSIVACFSIIFFLFRFLKPVRQKKD
eukprot:TRINITY_DN4058_c0_g1_i1.p1 TRINITY_DN4058_c0_g1~~TRINITY_DN4058_c0_g1_i1.p1  ORF type:complete len:427 (-),score=97.64 TRINITY_DN4058_c0_g1_i1:3-1232(-)